MSLTLDAKVLLKCLSPECEVVEGKNDKVYFIEDYKIICVMSQEEYKEYKSKSRFRVAMWLEDIEWFCNKYRSHIDINAQARIHVNQVIGVSDSVGEAKDAIIKEIKERITCNG
jgi:hypothetical protein